MIEFLEISDEDPTLFHSPMVRAIEKTFAYIADQGGIGLTPLKAFKRNFVNWAAAEFNWPYYSTDELLRFNKVLNEMDFLPLMRLHDVLIALKIGRHYKSEFTLTKAGQSLIGHPGEIFSIVAPLILFHVDHGSMGRDDKRLAGNWEIFLNVLNVEAHNGVTGEEVREILYGDAESSAPYSHIMGHLYIEVLRPLCWIGLLQEYRTTQYFNPEDTIFTKTPLWKAVLRLSTDDAVSTAIRH